MLLHAQRTLVKRFRRAAIQIVLDGFRPVLHGHSTPHDHGMHWNGWFIPSKEAQQKRGKKSHTRKHKQQWLCGAVGGDVALYAIGAIYRQRFASTPTCIRCVYVRSCSFPSTITAVPPPSELGIELASRNLFSQALKAGSDARVCTTDEGDFASPVCG